MKIKLVRAFKTTLFLLLIKLFSILESAVSLSASPHDQVLTAASGLSAAAAAGACIHS